MDLLQDRLSAVRQRARRVLTIYGLSLVATVFIGAALVIGLCDWVSHHSEWSLLKLCGDLFDDRGVRLILALGVIGGATYVALRWLIGPLCIPMSNVDLALRVEARHPGFKDSLASAVQFFEGGADPSIGSPALQQLVIARTLQKVERLDFTEIINTRAVRRMATLATCVCLFTAVVVGFNQSASAIAMQRLFLPFVDTEWPRQTDLRFLSADLQRLDHDPLDPLRVARGDIFPVYVENTVGRLPNAVRLEYRVEGGKLIHEDLRLTTVRDAAGEGHEVAVGQITAARGPIEFRALGGDHQDMPFFQMLVIPPPVLEGLRVSLTPPAYARQRPQTQEEGVGQVEGLVGTQVAIAVTVNKPLKSAALKLKDQKPRKVELAKDRKSLKAAFTIEQPGIDSWWLDLQDDEGFQNVDPPRFEVRGIADSVPDIFLELPATDLMITADAEISVRANARDDLGLQELRLAWQHIPIAAADPLQAPATVAEKLLPLAIAPDLPLQQAAELVWKFKELNLQPGDQIVFRAEALDACTVGPPHIGRSVSRTLTIVSPGDKAQELADRQGGLLDDLERAFKLQDQAHTQIRELTLQMEKTGALRPQDADTLQRVEMNQRQLARELTDPTDGLEKRAGEILQELKDNKLEDPETANRVKQIAGEIRRLGEQNLPAIADELTMTRKQVEGAKADPNQAKPDKPSGTGTPENPKSEKGATPASPMPKTDPDNGKADGPASPSSPNGTSNKPSGEKPTDKPGATASDPQKPDADKPAEGMPPGEIPPEGTPKVGSNDKPAQPGEKPETKPAAGGSQMPGNNPQPPVENQKSKIENPSNAQSPSLQRVSENQQAVLESLGEMLQQLAQWRNERDASRDVSEMIADQQQLRDETAKLGEQIGGAAEPTPQQKADLARLGERQRKQAEKLEGLEKRAREMVDRLEKNEPGSGETLKEALQHAAEQAVADQLREAAADIADNQTGKAEQSQQQALDGLKGVEDILKQRQADSESLVKKLKEAEEQLNSLRNEQEELKKKMAAAEQLEDAGERQQELEKLGKQQEELQQNLAKLTRTLQRLQVRQPSASAERALSRLERAQEQREAGNEEGAAQEEQEALDDLEQAQRELAAEREVAEEELAQEQLEKIADSLKALIPRQLAVLEETKRLDGLKVDGKLTRAQRASVLNLGETQLTLKAETDRMTETLTAAEVFALALKGASRHMQKAADLLSTDAETGAATQRAEEAARKRFEDLVGALKPSKEAAQAAKPQEGGEQPPAAEDSAAQTDGIPALAQLKMLKALQLELNQRTLELAESVDGALTDEQKAELAEIAQEQGLIADLARNLTKMATEMRGEDKDEPDKSDDKGAKDQQGDEAELPKADDK